MQYVPHFVPFPKLCTGQGAAAGQQPKLHPIPITVSRSAASAAAGRQCSMFHTLFHSQNRVQVKVLRPDNKGGRVLAVVLGRGQFVGERAVINDRLRSADCVAQGTVQVRTGGLQAGK